MQKTELTRLLSGYAPEDARDERHKEALLALAALPGDVFSRAHYAPGHVTASAFVLDPSRESLALIFHKKLGLWLQPGGHVEPHDEGLPEAALREALEETGLPSLSPALPGVFDVDVHEIPARKDEPAHLHFDLRFAFVAASTEQAFDSDEVGGFKWTPLSALLSGREALGTDDSVMRAARKLDRARR